jgi:hypothetical protein
MKKIPSLLSLFYFVSVGLAQADVTVVWSNSGNGVVASYSGTLDLTGYSRGIFVSDVTDTTLGASLNIFRGNVPASGSTHFSKQYDAFVNTDFTIAHRNGTFNGTEQAFGFYTDRGSFPSELYVPPGYVSGNQIEGQAVFANSTVLDVFGSDSFNFKVFDDGVNIVTFTSVPEPASGLFLVYGFSMVTLRRIRRASFPRGSLPAHE